MGNAAVLEPSSTQQYAADIYDYIVKVSAHFQVTPACIGIDAPLQPRRENTQWRVAEQALSAAGIRCFKTPTASEFDHIRAKAKQHLASGGELSRIPHVMQLWMLAGFDIAKRLAELAPVLEVFPQANIRLLQPNAPHKTRVGQADAQLKAIAEHTQWPVSPAEWQQLRYICGGARHDKVDAYSAAWVASLAPEQRRYFGQLGSEQAPADAIWVPKL